MQLTNSNLLKIHNYETFMLDLHNKSGKKVGVLNQIDRINAANAPEIKLLLNELLSEPGSQLVLNLKNIKFIDSSGIGALISALKTARQNDGSFQLCSIQKDVFSLLSLMKLDKVFDIYSSESECQEMIS